MKRILLTIMFYVSLAITACQPGFGMGIHSLSGGPDSAAGPSAIAPANLFKVLTLNFNSETASIDKAYKLRDLRFQAILDWIAVNDPDVILIQEGWNFHQDPSIAESIGRAAGYQVNYNLGLGFFDFFWDSDAILVKKKYPISEPKTWVLQPSAPFVGDGKTWVIELGAVTYGMMSKLNLESGESLFVVDTHLVGDTESDRQKQMDSLFQKVRETIEAAGLDYSHTKVIFGGDLNSSPESPAIVDLKKEGYIDSWEHAHPGVPNLTDCSDPLKPDFNPVTIVVNFPDQSDEDSDDPSDFIFYRGDSIQPLASSRVFTEPYEGVWMSDHFGVVTTFGVNGKMPTNYPNPIVDSPSSNPPPGDATVYDVLSKTFDANDYFLELEVHSTRGLVLVNRLSDDLKIHVLAEGRPVFSAEATTLHSDRSVAFIFTEAGDYPLELTDSKGKILFGVVHYSP